MGQCHRVERCLSNCSYSTFSPPPRFLSKHKHKILSYPWEFTKPTEYVRGHAGIHAPQLERREPPDPLLKEVEVYPWEHSEVKTTQTRAIHL